MEIWWRLLGMEERSRYLTIAKEKLLKLLLIFIQVMGINVYIERNNKYGIGEGAIQTVKWNENGNMLATASRDGHVELLDFRTLTALLRIPVGENRKPHDANLISK